MKRVFDILLSLILIFTLLIPVFFVSILIILTSNGGVLYWSKRIGLNSKEFFMPKFRTMNPNTPELATDLLIDGENYVTSFGRFLRQYSIDELPQLWSILIGDMSFVGPRPALFNQYDLIKLRKEKKIDTIRPGLTGLAQINGRDNLSIVEKVKFDEDYLKNISMLLDLKIIAITFFKTAFRVNIHH